MLFQTLLFCSALSLSLAAPQPAHFDLQTRTFSKVNADLVAEYNATYTLINAVYAVNGSGLQSLYEIRASNAVNQLCQNVTSDANASSTFTTANSGTLKDRLVALDSYFHTLVDLFKYKRDDFKSAGLYYVARRQLNDLRTNCYVTQATAVVGKTATASKAAVSSVYAQTRARLDDGIAYYP